MNTTTEYPASTRSTDTPLQTWIGTERETPDMVQQLNKHLADMNALCDQVKQARGECTEQGEDWCDLFDELIDTLEHHQGSIAEQLGEFHQHSEGAFHAAAPCVR